MHQRHARLWSATWASDQPIETPGGGMPRCMITLPSIAAAATNSIWSTRRRYARTPMIGLWNVAVWTWLWSFVRNALPTPDASSLPCKWFLPQG